MGERNEKVMKGMNIHKYNDTHLLVYISVQETETKQNKNKIKTKLKTKVSFLCSWSTCQSLGTLLIFRLSQWQTLEMQTRLHISCIAFKFPGSTCGLLHLSCDCSARDGHKEISANQDFTMHQSASNCKETPLI